MVGSLGMTVLAEDTSANEPIDTTVSNYNLTEEETSGKNQEEIKALQQQKIDEVTQQAYDMKIASNELENWPEGPATYGEAGIVMEAKSGAILYAKNIDGKAYPASITKILTALVALENGNLDDKITITQNSVDCVAEGDAYIGMIAGEEISLNESTIDAVLDCGGLVVCSMAPGDFTDTGHYILLRGYDSKGYFVNDPNRRSNSKKQWTFDTLSGQIKNLWAIYK